ncbi:MAG TPA: sulfotransferase family 2 domain-containing protein [Pseudomonadales bacterium]
MKVVRLGEMKLAYYSVPKVGKTAMKSVMDTLSRPDGDYRNYGDKLFSPLMRWRGRGCYRFTIVRDPVERLVSAYADRVADRDDIRRSVLSVVLARLLGLDPSPDLNTFALNLKKYALINDRIFRHVVPQLRYIGRDPGFYDAIFSIREMDKVAATLSELSGREVSIRRANASKAKVSKADLSPAALAALQDFYREDYRLYGQYF